MRYSFILGVSFILIIPTIGVSATLKVPGQYPNIQDAIDVAVAGDTVLVDPGTYDENIDFKGKAITVKSSGGAGTTVIDGHQSGISVVTFMSGEGADSILDGFAVTNGAAKYGGGIYCSGSSPTLTNNIIKGNTTIIGAGGGIFCDQSSSPAIANNTVTGNTSELCGGICCIGDSSPAITNNTLNGNIAKWASGGIYCFSSSPAIMNNIISENRAGTKGGGIYCYDKSHPTIENNVISDNTAEQDNGGGIYCDTNASPSIANNIITGNIAEDYGGGIYNGIGSDSIVANNLIDCNSAHDGGGIFSGSSSIIKNNSVTGNTASNGGGINCSDLAIVMNNTIAGNTAFRGGGISAMGFSSGITNNTIWGNKASQYGGGIFLAGSTPSSIKNTIIWNNSAPESAEIWIEFVLYPCTVNISHSDVKGGAASVHVEQGSILNWGAGMIDSDPLFVDPAEGDFHLTFNSPCRGSGTNAAPGLPEKDFEGDPRIAYGTVDMGADEFFTHLYWTGDATPGGTVEVKFVGLPGAAPVGLCLGSGVLDPPIPSMWGDWYLAFPIIGPVNLGSITSPEGVLVVTGVIPTSHPPPYSIPMQALIGAELTNLSVLEIK